MYTKDSERAVLAFILLPIFLLIALSILDYFKTDPEQRSIKFGIALFFANLTGTTSFLTKYLQGNN